MSSFFINWNSLDISHGNNMASVEAITEGYRIAWEVEAPDLKSASTFWTLDISESTVVPVPTAGLLMISGILALAGFCRQRS